MNLASYKSSRNIQYPSHLEQTPYNTQYVTINSIGSARFLKPYSGYCWSELVAGEFDCGRRLATAMAFQCNNHLIKRTPQYIPTADISWLWMEAHGAHSLGKKRKLASECCDKPCSINELLSYCGN
ncbi:unnamed protein product [Euphydryas editha]|uniref:Insulin-like domain-containing protein n=1 Tax=Euphydryas editha TaxID=104508 RepID=A0AAU9UI58_EUPED|nr:unnamed protein product [Euphydryas editha]